MAAHDQRCRSRLFFIRNLPRRSKRWHSEFRCGRSCSLGGFEEGLRFIHKVPSSIALNTNHIKPNSFMHRAETIDEPFYDRHQSLQEYRSLSLWCASGEISSCWAEHVDIVMIFQHREMLSAMQKISSQTYSRTNVKRTSSDACLDRQV
jgi:hypothetical protein